MQTEPYGSFRAWTMYNRLFWFEIRLFAYADPTAPKWRSFDYREMQNDRTAIA